jgi:hypothetical membrane protein
MGVDAFGTTWRLMAAAQLRHRLGREALLALGASARLGTVNGPSRYLEAAGIIGPVAFVADWAILGVVAPHYDPIRDTISRLAQKGVPTRAPMTVGFALYGASLPLFALAPGQRLPPSSRAMVAVTGLATLVLAAFPVSVRTGSVHAASAAAGYLTLTAAPLFHARDLHRSGRRGRALASAAVGVACGALLVASVAAPATGFLQRAGLTVGDAWIVGHAIASNRRSAPSGAPGIGKDAFPRASQQRNSRWRRAR